MEYSQYEMIMDYSSFHFINSAYIVHGLLIGLQLGLVVYLLASGLVNIFWHDRKSTFLQKIGIAVKIPAEKHSKYGYLKMVLGLILLLPLFTGLSFLITGLSCLVIVGVMVSQERLLRNDSDKKGWIVRKLVSVTALICCGFIFYNSADNLSQGVNLMLKALNYRDHETAWQVENDKQSPKLGDLAPDFELTDTTGNHQIRLSNFRNQKPVVLVFGAHT